MGADKQYILIVGASGGIGRAISSALAEKDAALILMGRRENRLRDLQRELSCESRIALCDIRDNNEISRFFEMLKGEGIKLSGMVYCAGVCFVKSLKAMEEGELEDMFRTNVFGFYELCRHFQSSKISVKGASIVALSSYASVSKEPGMSAYAMSKAAMNTMVQVLAKELAKREIRINAVLPAVVMSRMGEDNDEWTQEEMDVGRTVQSYGFIPKIRIAEMVEFLLSQRSSHTTGGLFEISAGFRGC